MDKNNAPELEKLVIEIEDNLREHLKSIGHLNPRAIAEEYISEKRIKEQLANFEKYTGPLAGKKMLEIGSGFGMLVAYANKYLNCDAYGIEPSADEYSSTFNISRKLLKIFELDENKVVNGAGENLPWPDNYFDLIYSINVLEHTGNPEKVVAEAIRVLKPGGYLQIVVPNFGSFWEGHYCIFWLPYLPHFLARIYLRLLGRKPFYIGTLQFVNYFKLKRWLRANTEKKAISILSFGEEVFRERMNNADFSDWGGLAILKSWLNIARKIKLNKLFAEILIALKAQTPIILTIKKNEKVL